MAEMTDEDKKKLLEAGVGEDPSNIQELIFMLKGAIFDYRAPQRAFDPHSEVVTARLEPCHLMMIARSLQAEARRARAFMAREGASEEAVGFAQEYAATREVYSQQMMLHLRNALSEYQPEDAHSQHSLSDDYLKRLGLDTDPLPQDP